MTGQCTGPLPSQHKDTKRVYTRFISDSPYFLYVYYENVEVLELWIDLCILYFVNSSDYPVGLQFIIPFILTRFLCSHPTWSFSWSMVSCFAQTFPCHKSGDSPPLPLPRSGQCTLESSISSLWYGRVGLVSPSCIPDQSKPVRNS